MVLQKVHPVPDDPSGLEAFIHFFEVNGLLFQGPPQPFDKDVVEVASAPIHRDAHSSNGQRRDPCRSGKLAVLIRVHDLGRAEFGDGFVQSLDAEASVHCVR